MKKIVAIAGICCLFGTAAQADLLSTFDAGTDGWTAVDPTGDYTASWSSLGGNPGGFLEGNEFNALGGTGYFIAPSGWLGNLSVYAGGTFSYDIKVISGTSYFGGDPDIVISGPGGTVSYLANINPVGNGWVSISVPLTGAYFTGGNLAAILPNVTSIRIRGELIDGPEVEGVDNIRISASAVPGPMVGAGLPGFVAGLGGLLMWRRRRQQTARVA